jgi:large subunit ribosomal protein L15
MPRQPRIAQPLQRWQRGHRDAAHEKGLVKNTTDGVKILGKGKLTKKLAVKVHAYSKSAEKAIVEKAGGTAEVIK